MKFTCPECKGTDVSVEVKTWCRFDVSSNEDGTDYQEDRSFDYEDLDSVEVLPGERICHGCQHFWTGDGAET